MKNQLQNIVADNPRNVTVQLLLEEYAKTLTVLERYDRGVLGTPKGTKAIFELTYEDARAVLDEVRARLIEKSEGTDLFARERGGEFEGIIRGLYQSFGGKHLYPTIESKAAHLLYFIIKDHPFSDGNKRSAAFLFVYLLDKNNTLFKPSGERKIHDNTLAALALLVAESDPKEKETMVNLVANLIVG
jgi:prophage maintenance system killer protein